LTKPLLSVQLSVLLITHQHEGEVIVLWNIYIYILLKMKVEYRVYKIILKTLPNVLKKEIF